MWEWLEEFDFKKRKQRDIEIKPIKILIGEEEVVIEPGNSDVCFIYFGGR